MKVLIKGFKEERYGILKLARLCDRNKELVVFKKHKCTVL